MKIIRIVDFNSVLNRMHLDKKNNKVYIELREGVYLGNSRGDTWSFPIGWVSDGHSTGEYFKHFDAWTAAALCHDQECEQSWKEKRYDLRRTGDKNYKFNLKELGAPKSTVYRRYAAVSARTRWLKITRRIK